MSRIAERSGILWTPDDLLDLISVEVDGEADQSAIQGMHLINQSGRNWLDNQLDTETYLDVLASCGLDPYAFLDEAVEHVDYLESHGTR
jgi:hypothetical protein